MRIIQIFGILFLLTSCVQNDINQVDSFYLSGSKCQFGDCFAFHTNSGNYGAALVLGFSKELGEIWYGLCFTDYNDETLPSLGQIGNFQLAGRKVESTFEKEGYFRALDILFLHDTCFDTRNRFSFIGNLEIDQVKVKYGAQGATSDITSFLESNENARKNRIDAPDDYRDHRTKLNGFQPHEYFEIKSFLMIPNSNWKTTTANNR